MAIETATLAGGCFWCLEAVFDQLSGVQSVESGYMGGKTENPTYEDICTGRTDHAEVVRLSFDPAVVSFRDLLAVFFTIHDPTTLNRQGNDVGTQYRSAIFFHSPGAGAAPPGRRSRSSRRKSSGRSPSSPRWCRPRRSGRPRTTTRSTSSAWARAIPTAPIVVEPKVAKFRKHFVDRLKKRVSHARDGRIALPCGSSGSSESSPRSVATVSTSSSSAAAARSSASPSASRSSGPTGRARARCGFASPSRSSAPSS